MKRDKYKKNIVTEKNSYNTIAFVIFALLITGSFTYFSFAEDTDLTLFEDFDRDGISNSEEEVLGTDPKNPDSDGDGYSDGVEIESGYNPLITAPGDRIIKEKEPVQFVAVNSQTTNVTKKISEDVVSFIADSQESGNTDITSEEFSDVISDAINKEVAFTQTPPVDISEIAIQEQECDGKSTKECKEKTKEAIIEYFTAMSYVFVSSFPQDFFNKQIDVFQAEMMSQINNFSGSLTEFSYFEELAENALVAEEQMENITVPEEMLEIHAEGLYLLRYAGDIYQSGGYKNISSDITPMIATLAQIQGLIELSVNFQDHVMSTLEEYEIEDVFFDL